MDKPKLDHEGNLIRGVRCALCQKEMFYEGSGKETPEFTLSIKLPKWQEPVQVKGLTSMFGMQDFYVHVECWNNFVGDRKITPSTFESGI